jgi:hypothetical protein
MSDDETKKLSDRQLLEQISRRLAAVESFVEDRSRDTRPLLGQIQKELADFRGEFLDFKQEMRHELRMLREDLTAERKQRLVLEDRIEELERPKQ